MPSTPINGRHLRHIQAQIAPPPFYYPLLRRRHRRPAYYPFHLLQRFLQDSPPPRSVAHRRRALHRRENAVRLSLPRLDHAPWPASVPRKTALPARQHSRPYLNRLCPLPKQPPPRKTTFPRSPPRHPPQSPCISVHLLVVHLSASHISQCLASAANKIRHPLCKPTSPSSSLSLSTTPCRNRFLLHPLPLRRRTTSCSHPAFPCPRSLSAPLRTCLSLSLLHFNQTSPTSGLPPRPARAPAHRTPLNHALLPRPALAQAAFSHRNHPFPIRAPARAPALPRLRPR